jgi:protein-disulfide isomerase
MSRFFRLAHPVPARASRTGLFPTGLALALASTALLLATAASAHAQFGAPSPGTQVHDTSALHPPPGARVAIVEFYDLECPDCRAANPVLKQAVATYKIPWVHHDFLIPGHAWSPIAAVNARWFDAKSKALGDEYRDEVFENQPSFYNNPDLLRQFTEKFAKSHGIALPFALDPQGKLAADVNADKNLGMRIGVDHTPTIWIVTAGSKGPPFIEVTDRSKLYQIIDQALADTPPIKPAAPAKPQTKKTASK